MTKPGKPYYMWSIACVLVLSLVTTVSAGELRYECTTNPDGAGIGQGNWKVIATAKNEVDCQPAIGGKCSEMDYTIIPLQGLSPDHVAIMVDHEMVVENTDLYSSRSIYRECLGEAVTGLGFRNCAFQTVRMNQDSDTDDYTLSVVGPAAPEASSIVIKKGRTIEACRIVTLGPSTCDPKAQQASKKVFEFEDCIVEIVLNPCTGEPGDAQIVSGSCGIMTDTVDSLKIVINGESQNVTTGDGWISSGENSCTTTLFKGRSYTTCTCKDASDCLVKNSSGKYVCDDPNTLGYLEAGDCPRW